MAEHGGDADDAAQRRLAAILAADVVGYSRLMHADDQAALRLLTESRALFSEHVGEHGGRIVNAPGDSVLAEFGSVVKAVECALHLQRLFAVRNALLPADRRMLFRMGVNLGDVLVDAAGVYGNGVNVAARLETLCEPGAVAISASAYEQVRDRLAVRFTDAGEHTVKNIERPVHVYRIGAGAATMPGDTTVQSGPSARRPLRRRWPWMVAGATLATALALVWVVSPALLVQARDAVGALAGGANNMATDRATVAVLPFTNQSGDAQRDYFSDGITEDIIHALGRFSGVVVVSNNAVQAYRERAATSDAISRELGVRYIARGSVRESDGRLRVAIELSDASTGKQLWSDRFEDGGQKLFEIQDQIVRNIVGALAVKLSNAEQQRAFSKPTDNLAAYHLVLRARKLHARAQRDSNREARQVLAQALEMSPGYAAAYVALADAEWHRAVYGWVEDPAAALQRSEALIHKALAIEEPGSHVRAHGLLGILHSVRGDFDGALREVNLALDMNGSDASAYASRAGVLLWKGRFDEAIASGETGLRFDPNPAPGVLYELAFAYYMAGRHKDAVMLAERTSRKHPEFHNLHVIRMMALAESGDIDGARLAHAQVQEKMPFFQPGRQGTRFEKSADRDKVQASLRKAGA